MTRITSTDIIHILVKSHGETFCFSFDEANRTRLIATVVSMAMDRDLAFDWHDADAVCDKVNEVFA